MSTETKNECSYCGRVCKDWRGLNSHERSCKQQKDKLDKVVELYYDKGFGLKKCAREVGVTAMTVKKWLEDNGYETRSRLESQKTIHPYFGMKSRGHPFVGAKSKGSDAHAYIHQLVAIADGADPYEIFDKGGKVIHHKNGIPWDNRPANLLVTTHSEHAKMHRFWEINNES